MDYITRHLPSFTKAVTYQLLTPALCKASRWVPCGISPPREQLRLRYAQWASTGIWAAANQWLSFAVDRIHHDRGTFSEWSLSTCISVTETLVKGANQRGHILWLLVPWALSPSQRNKKKKTQPLSSEQKSTCTANWLLSQMGWGDNVLSSSPGF